MIEERIKKDIVIVGGGLAGICGAISAARSGKKVALIQNRSVLGGNSSSEIRVWVSSATKHGVNRYARETGIMGELFVENQYRNIDGNPYIWDVLLLEKVKQECNIELFLNTEIQEVDCQDDHIMSVVGYMQGSERRLTFEGTFFVDATGDGTVGFLAGNDYMLGREARSEFSESLAPAVADDELMGSTLLFYTKEEEHSVPFVAPEFAKKIEETSILKNRVIRSGDKGANYWWIEWGGEKDVVHDNELIQDELLSIIYGIWDYIKNSGNFSADKLTLEWIGTIPGKREYRRLVGDYVLKQQDIETQRDFEDTIGFGGWSIDLHPAKGIYNENGGAHHAVADGIYPIPYRMLYSAKVDNLFMAGRDVSTTHVAFGGIRIMGTCALMGEAVGTAAALAIDEACTPREIYTDHLQKFQQILLKNDASLLGISNQDPTDVVRESKITSSGFIKQIKTYTNHYQEYHLKNDVAISFPVSPSFTSVKFLYTATEDTELTVELWETGKPQNYIPHKFLKDKTISLPKGSKKWIEVPLSWLPIDPQTAFVIIKMNPQVALFLGNKKFPGVLSYENVPMEEMNHPDLHQFTRESPILYWTTQGIHNQNFIFEVKGETNAYQPGSIKNGLVRAYGLPNLWSTRFQNSSEWVQIDFASKQRIKQLHLTLDDDINEDLINLHHHYTEHRIMPELVKDFKIYYLHAGIWQEFLTVSDNRKRHHILELEEAIYTDAIKVEFFNTNGSEFISVYEIRAYGEEL